MRDSKLSYLKFLPLAVFIISTIIAAVRLEGRVNAHDLLFEERKSQETQQWLAVREQLKDIKSQLVEVNRKLDEKRDKFGPFR